MNLQFRTTWEMTPEQAQAIDAALKSHRITVPDGWQYGQFDWLCERIERALKVYALTKDGKPQSRADALTDIEKLQSAFERIGSGAKGIISEAALHTMTERITHQAGLSNAIPEAIGRMQYDGTGAFGQCSEDVSEALCNRDPGASLFSLAWSLLNEACDIALSGEPPKSCITGLTGWEDANIIEAHTPNVKGGRPTDVAKQDLVRDLASEFHAATGRRATDTEAGPFDDFLTACLAIVEPPKPAGTSNRKLIRKALEHVPKPRRKN